MYLLLKIALIVLVLYLMRRPIGRFLSGAWQNAYGRAIALAGKIIFVFVGLIVIALILIR